MKHKQILTRPWLKLIAGVSAVLLTLTAIGGVLPISAAASEIDSAPQSDALTNDITTAKLSPLKLLSHLLPQPMTDEERAWLEAEGQGSIPAELTLTYDGTVPHDQLTLSFAENGQVTVTAQVYHGDSVGTVWTPAKVTLNGTTHTLTAADDGYTATIPCDTQALVTVTVAYEAELSVSVDAVNTLLNAAYTRGTEINAAYDAYQKALDDHTAATKAYTAYRAALQQYKADLSLYNAYLSAQKDYEERRKVYEAYLNEVAVYEKALAVYQTYLTDKAAYDKAYAAYTEFINYPAEYEKKYLAYCDYLATLDKVKAQLAILDSCFVTDSVGHVLNGTLNGPTVATVVSRQDELVSVGVDAKDIANADMATKRLITLLADYPQKGEDAERYAYYIGHYTEIRDNVTLLYTSLSRLYGNDAVPDILKMQGRLERYWQFVAQLYALSCAMEDEIAFDVNWKISTASLTDLLEPCFILNDTNTATPLSAYPPYMEPVTAPSDMKMPTAPAVVEQPVAPLKVAEPTPPETVNKPTMPAMVPSPGPKPTQPVFTNTEKTLANAVKAGKLSERATLTEYVGYPLSLDVDACGTGGEIPVAAFYDYDRMTLLHATFASDGTALFPSEQPNRPDEQGETFTFSGWIDGQGTTYLPETTQTEISKTTVFYALYASETQKYTVTWDVDGVLTEEIYAFGEIPVYEGDLHKAEDGIHVYSFIGWSPVISPVSRDVTYTAVFEAVEKIFEVQWIIGDTSETEEYPLGELPVYSGVPTLPMDGRYRYVFKQWSPEIVAVDGNAVYTAVFEAIDLLEGNEKGTVTEKNGTVTVIVSGQTDVWRLPISALADYAAEKHSRLELSMGGVTLTFGGEDVALLSTSDVAVVRLEGIDGQTSLRLSLLDKQGEEMSLDADAHLSVLLSENRRCMVKDGDGNLISSVANGVMTALLKSNATYTLQKGFAITTETSVLGVADGQGGLCLPSVSLADDGETVTLTVTAAPGFAINTVTLRDWQGIEIPLTADGNGIYRFTMPPGEVSVIADFTPITYTVIFRVGETVISSETYRYGDEPVIPENPTRADDDTYSYTFTGWSPTVTAVMGDAVYEAQFMAVPLNGQSSVVDKGMSLVQLFFLGLGTFAVPYAAIMVPYVIVTRKKSAEATTADTEESEVEEA